jgi:hypothetical protein
LAIELSQHRKINANLENRGRKSYFINVMQNDDAKRTCPARKWTKRAGIIAFLFFLGKGLVWLGVFAAGAYYTFN